MEKIEDYEKLFNDFQRTAMYDREKRIREKHDSQTTTYIQFEKSDGIYTANVLNDREYEIRDTDYLLMMAKVRRFLAFLTEDKPEYSQHIAAYGAEKHPAFAAALTAGCADFKVSLTLVYIDSDGRTHEQYLS